MISSTWTYSPRSLPFTDTVAKLQRGAGIPGGGEYPVRQAGVDHGGVLDAVVQGHPLHDPAEGLAVHVLVEAEFEGRLGVALGAHEPLLAHTDVGVGLAVHGHGGTEPGVDVGEGPGEAVFLDFRDHVLERAGLVAQGVPILAGDFDADVQHALEGEVGIAGVASAPSWGVGAGVDVGSGAGSGRVLLVSAPSGSLVASVVGAVGAVVEVAASVAGVAVGDPPASSAPPPQPAAMTAVATSTVARRQCMATGYKGHPAVAAGEVVAAFCTGVGKAERCGIDQGDISRIERGATSPTARTLQRIAEVLHADVRLVARASSGNTRVGCRCCRGSGCDVFDQQHERQVVQR